MRYIEIYTVNVYNKNNNNNNNNNKIKNLDDSAQNQPLLTINWEVIPQFQQAELTTHLRRSWVPQPPPAVPLEDLQGRSGQCMEDDI